MPRSRFGAAGSSVDLGGRFRRVAVVIRPERADLERQRLNDVADLARVAMPAEHSENGAHCVIGADRADVLEVSAHVLQELVARTDLLRLAGRAIGLVVDAAHEERKLCREMRRLVDR